MIAKASLGSTLRRAAHTIRLAWAGRRLHRAKSEQDRALARQALAAIFIDGRGVTMKIGQIFAERNGDESLRPLIEGIPPRPLTEMMPVLEEALNQPLDTVFSSIDETAAAASLGQVHRALLQNGTEVAVKIRYPDIADAVAAEMRLAGLLPKAGPVRRWSFNLDGYKKVLLGNMDRELDYRSEAARQQQFGASVKVEGLRVPTVYPTYCSETVLVQSFERGVSLDEAATWALRDRLLIGRTLIMTMFKSLFVGGEVHGDPHPGNLRYRKDVDQPCVVLLDFGCTVPVSLQQRLALLKLITALHHGENTSPLQCFAAMGFDAEKLSYIDAELPVLTRALFKPFLDHRPFDPAEWGLGATFEDTLGEKRWWFRSSGPPELLLLLRAFQGLVSQLERLSVRIPWWPLLVAAVGEQTLNQARSFELPTLSATLHRPETVSSGSASVLRVQLDRGDEILASLSFPPAAALDLESLIPESVVSRLAGDSRKQFAEAADRVRETGLVPQQLLLLAQGDQSVRVWLE